MSSETAVLLSVLFASSFAFQSSSSGKSSISLQELLGGHELSSTTERGWTGKWFPTPPPTHGSPVPQIAHGGVPMGTLNPNCDDAKTNLTRDWNFSPTDYTCFFPNKRIIPDVEVQPHLDIESVPKQYSAVHYCMNETIFYQNPLPTFGPHRPAWPRYGEYTYLPVQRWLHTLEHGGVVMLYHPCAHPLEIERLRQIVRSCLFRHVISPNQHLTMERPLALITWGKRLTMSVVNIERVKDFIKQNALDGPEREPRDGQYDTGLIKEAGFVSDTEDTQLCPEGKIEDLRCTGGRIDNSCLFW